MSYVELHCKSNFSFLEGASHPEDLIARAGEIGYGALAITDRNGLYGVVRFSEAAVEQGVRPIFGSEITLENGTHLVLLVKNRFGYANLSRMLGAAQMLSKKGEAKVSEALLAQCVDGLIALSGDVLSGPLLLRDYHEARRIAARYAELFGGGNFYLELVHHNLPVHEYLCEEVPRLGKKLGLPVVATNDVYYARAEDRKLQDVLTCIKNHTTLDNADDVLYPNAERYMKSAIQMKRKFAGYPGAIENAVRIAETCDFSLKELKTVLPDFPVPPGETSFSYFRKLTYEGARQRWDEPNEKQIKQLEHELRIIHKLDLSGYFLIVWDIARFCREQKILCQGRGSAANSAVCYCLGITAVDPIKLELLFERFVSEERKEPPDIDIDIAHNRREEAIQYVYNRYGREHAAMVCEVISYRGRSAVRDVGKALGFSLGDLDRLAKLVGSYSGFEELDERIHEAQFNLDDHRVKLLAELCCKIKRFPRHLGIHVGGMVVTKRPLAEIVPIENATMPDRSVIQWDKDDAEAVRLVKIDLLGLGMLTLIDMALKLVKEHRGVEIDPAKLSYDDPKVYELLQKADTVGVFQVESRAQMNTLPRHKPERFYDLVVEVALIRPGPIQGDMVHPYLRRRNGEEEVTYPHPVLEPILKRTLGVPLFQEQGMRVAMEAAGFSPSEADELRRAMGHKRSHEKMEQISFRLISGMMRNGISKEAAERIYTQLAAFADFGFAESHAASFALLVYVSAFLKVYYQTEFYCAILNAQPLGFYSPSTIVYEGTRRGMEFLPVDCTRSKWDCTVEGNKVRLGFRYVRYMGDGVKEKMEEELARGPFRSIKDFVYRTELNQLALEQLAMVGAFEAFGVSRRQALWTILSIVRQSPDELEMHGDTNGGELLPDMDILERLALDFKGMDLSLGPHPMALVRSSMKRRRILCASDLPEAPVNRKVQVAGMVVIRQRPVTASGFLFITMEDETGFINVVVKPDFVKRFRKAVMFAGALVVTGMVEKKDGVINVIGHDFEAYVFERGEVKVRSRDFR